MKYLTVTEAKKRLLELLREADTTFERYCITRNGEPKAILLSIDEFESWIETLEIMSDPSARADIKKARKELDAGKGISFETLLDQLRG
jgi:antitoxin YefM